MARIVGVFQMTHSPFCYRRAEDWDRVRSTRPIRADVPIDDLESNRRKHARVQHGFAALRQRLAEAGADVIVIFGDDQLECFDFSNHPAFSIYVGEEFEGFLPGDRVSVDGVPAADPPAKVRLKGHPGLATALLTGLMKRGMDPAFSMDMPKPDVGIGHAFMNPAHSLTELRTPIVPLLINCYYAPQPTAARCRQLGRAVREIVDEYPEGLRVVLVGSGGLWHTPQRQDAWLDEAFDEALLGYMAKGEIESMAAYFDNYRIPAGDRSQDIGARGRHVTGMPALGGPQGGTRETCNWIAAAGAVEGATAVIVDRVAIYASPIDAAFAYFNL